MGKSKADIDLREVQETDLERAGEIFVLAFANDPVSAYVCPPRLHNPSLTHEERVSNRARSLRASTFGKPGTHFIKAVDRQTGQIMGVSIWLEPAKANAAPEEEAEEFDDPEEDSEFLGKMIKQMKALKEKQFPNNAPHWYLKFVVVDPSAQGRGVGSALVGWGISRSKEHDPPVPAYLEASAVGIPVYEALGFHKVPGGEVEIDSIAGEGSQKKGEERIVLPTMLRPADARS